MTDIEGEEIPDCDGRIHTTYLWGSLFSFLVFSLFSWFLPFLQSIVCSSPFLLGVSIFLDFQSCLRIPFLLNIFIQNNTSHDEYHTKCVWHPQKKLVKMGSHPASISLGMGLRKLENLLKLYVAKKYKWYKIKWFDLILLFICKGLSVRV